MARNGARAAAGAVEAALCAGVMAAGMVDTMWLGDRMLPTALWAAVFGLCALVPLFLGRGGADRAARRPMRVHRAAHFLGMAALIVVAGARGAGAAPASLAMTGMAGMPGMAATAGSPQTALPAIVIGAACLAVSGAGFVAALRRRRPIPVHHRGELIVSSALMTAMVCAMAA
jgi:hypothetical protein